MPGAPRIFDRSSIRQRRDRAAAKATGASLPDFLLERVADDFALRLSLVRRDFPLCVSLGAYHGLLAERLRQLPSIGTIIDVEPSFAALARAGGLKVVADEEALPFAAGSLDLVMSGLSLHLVNDLPGALIQINRALKPDGLFLGAMLGGETLKELREAWIIAEDEVLGGASPRVAPFADVRELGGLLQRAGFALPVADNDIVEVTYASPLALMQELRAMAASNPLTERRRTPVTRGLLLRAAEIYQERFGLPNGRIPATFEIVTLTGWVPHESQQKPLQPGSAQVSLKDVLKPRSTDPSAKG
ncbi:methyltransferase domain-containing protein [Hyphomicrobium sp.]|uniref:methyltransferase domain-containing protein n=1 Tax=Hyphomicrobium sp. TaxID=82 RepID=UPI002D790B65|nr:methyltransferase domain-containing protein [Hyphomicrobium sp.]HET6391094.1 methyltransferase domain-containing protein [Hyphomicrobium sp.]